MIVMRGQPERTENRERGEDDRRRYGKLMPNWNLIGFVQFVEISLFVENVRTHTHTHIKRIGQLAHENIQNELI